MKAVIEIVVIIEYKTELMLKKMEIAVAPWRVCQYKGNDNADAEHDASRLLLINKMLQRHYQSVIDGVLILSHHILKILISYLSS